MENNKKISTCSYSETDFISFNENSFLFCSLDFSDEQKKVLDILEINDLCILNGGPGTGKTQTLINLMTHNVCKDKKVLFCTKNKSSLHAFKELMPDYLIKYTLIFSEQSDVNNIRVNIKPYLKNILEIINKNNLESMESKYTLLKKKYDFNNDKLVNINKKIKYLLELNQKVISLNEKDYTYQTAYEFLNTKKNQPMLIYNFSEEDYNALSLIDWKNFILKLNILSNNNLKFFDMDKKILTYSPMIYPNGLIASQEDILKKLKKNKLSIEGSMRELNKRENFPTILQKSEEFKQLSIKYSIFLDEKMKQNFIKFFYRRKSLHLIEGSLMFLLDNMDQILENVNLDVFFPSSDLNEKHYIKELEQLSEGLNLDSLISKIVKKKQKDFFSKVLLSNKKVQTSEQWKKIYKKVIMDKKIEECSNKWNEHAKTFGLPLLDITQPIDFIVLDLKRNLDIFYIIAGLYIQIEQMIIPYMVLPGNPLENMVLLQNYINTLSERNFLQSVLAERKEDMSNFIKDSVFTINDRNIANDFLKKEDFDSIYKIFEKEIKNEEIYNQIKNAYQDINLTLNNLNGNSNAINFVNSFLEDGYNLKIDPSELTLCIKKTLLNQFVKNLNNTDSFSELLEDKKSITTELKMITTELINNRIETIFVKKNIDGKLSSLLDTINSLISRIDKGLDSKECYVDIQLLLKSVVSIVPCIAMRNIDVINYFQGNEEIADLLLIDDASNEGFEYFSMIRKGSKVVVSGNEKMYYPINRYTSKNFDLLKNKYLMTMPLYLYQMITPNTSLLDIITSFFYKNKIMLSSNFRNCPGIFKFINNHFYENSIDVLKPEIEDFSYSILNTSTDEETINFLVKKISAISKNNDLNKTIGFIMIASQEKIDYLKLKINVLIPKDIFIKNKILIGSADDFQGIQRDVVFIYTEKNYINKNLMEINNDFHLSITRAKEKIYIINNDKENNFINENEFYISLYAYIDTYGEKVEFTGSFLIDQCKSLMEQDIMAYFLAREYIIRPNIKIGHLHAGIMICSNTNSRKLLIDIEGGIKDDNYCWQKSIDNQISLEELGWNFQRILYSQYFLNKNYILDAILKRLNTLGIAALNRDN